MKPLTLRFPKRMTIELPEPLRQGLEAIADKERHESDEQLVQVVLSRGIVSTLANVEGDDRSAVAEVAGVRPDESLKLKKAHRVVLVAEQLYARAKHRCGS
jgi:hypothetical protein